MNIKKKNLPFFPDRKDGCGRAQDSFCCLRGSGIAQTRQLLIPYPDGVRTLPAQQIHRLPAPPLMHPAENASATHARVTRGKHTQAMGHCFSSTPSAFRAAGSCWCFGSCREEVSVWRLGPERSLSLDNRSMLFRKDVEVRCTLWVGPYNCMGTV